MICWRCHYSRGSTISALVDTVAYVTRKAILEPDNEAIHRAYAEIRENLRTEREGQALTLVRYTNGEESVDEARYRLVL